MEAPTALRGSFDVSHLQLPPEVLISVMKKHQRYFPVRGLPVQPGERAACCRTLSRCATGMTAFWMWSAMATSR